MNLQRLRAIQRVQAREGWTWDECFAAARAVTTKDAKDDDTEAPIERDGLRGCEDAAEVSGSDYGD